MSKKLEAYFSKNKFVKIFILSLIMVFIFGISVSADCEHTWTEWEKRGMTEDCSVDGEYRYCTSCYEEETRGCDHEYGDWEWNPDTVDCSVDGEYRRCSFCNKEETRSCSHNYGEWERNYDVSATDKDYYIRYCNKCNVTETKSESHSWGEWEITKEPTVSKKGIKKAACEVCGKKKTASIDVVKITCKGKTVSSIAPSDLNQRMGKSTKANTYTITLPKGISGIAIPVKISKPGELDFYVVSSSNVFSDCLENRLYTKASCEKCQSSSISSKGTYYLYLGKEKDSKAASVTLKIGEYVSGNTTMKENTWCGCANKSYLKISVPNDGYITVTAKGRIIFSLCNSKKKEYICNDVNVYENTVTSEFAVKKGVYYLKTGTSGEYGFVKYKFTKYKTVRQNSSNTAVAVKKNTSTRMVFYSDGKKTSLVKYFKIKLSKKQRVKITADTIYLCTIYDSNGNNCGGDAIWNRKTKQYNVYTDNKLKPGTYYIVFEYMYSYADSKETTGNVVTFKWQ